MSPQEVANAVHKALADTGRANLNEKLARTTMSGAEGMIQDAMTRLENSVGGSNLQGTIRVLDTVIDDINKIATAVKDVPGLGDKVFGTGAFLLMTGAVLKGVAAWRTYAAIQKTATAVAAIERTGEAAKVPIANSEAAAVTKSTGAFNGLRGMLLKAGTATLGVNAAAASTTRILAAGVGTVALYAVAIAGLVYDIKLVVDSFQELRPHRATKTAISPTQRRGVRRNLNMSRCLSASTIHKNKCFS